MSVVVTTLRPMLVSSGPLRPDSDKYAFEVKWDGFRALVHASGGRIHVVSRNGNDMTHRYPELHALGEALEQDVVLDGEIVALGDDGNPDFAALWFRDRSGPDYRPARLCFMAFDVLACAGEDLTQRPYSERRAALEQLRVDGPHWCTPPSHVGDGAALFAATRRMGLEGVVAKRRDSRYRPGLRTKSWTKTKHMQSRSFALLGWIPPEEWRGDRGCVVVGLRTELGIAVAGWVESGYGRELVDELPQLTRTELEEHRAPQRLWTRPTTIVGEIRFLEWSAAGGLRHATVVSWG
jgi:bifunctional non-homologous end joining protein LigD